MLIEAITSCKRNKKGQQEDYYSQQAARKTQEEA